MRRRTSQGPASANQPQGSAPLPKKAHAGDLERDFVRLLDRKRVYPKICLIPMVPVFSAVPSRSICSPQYVYVHKAVGKDDKQVYDVSEEKSCLNSVAHRALSETTKSNSPRFGGYYGKWEGEERSCLESGFPVCVLSGSGWAGWWRGSWVDMSAFEKPQIISHIQKGLNYTVFDCKWVPCSAKFVTMGNFARGTGVIQLYEIQHGDLKLLREVGAKRNCPVPGCGTTVGEGASADLRVGGVCISFCPSLRPASPKSTARAARNQRR